MNRHNLQNLHPIRLKYFVSEGFFCPADTEPLLFKTNMCSIKVVTSSAIEIYSSKTPIVWEKTDNSVDIHFLNGLNNRVITLPDVEHIEYIA